MNIRQQRFRYAAVAVGIIAIALGLRAIWAWLPFFINVWLGDFLWAVMLYYLGIALFWPANKRVFTVALVVFCWFIEGSQAFHTPWLDAFRDTGLGGLLLGHGFLWSDIISYTAGSIAAYWWDDRGGKIF